MKVKKQQTKALKLIRNDNEYEQKARSLKEQLSKIKEECKNLNEKLIENERTLRKNHEIYITKQAKIKEIQSKINENKEKSKNPQPAGSAQLITNQMIQDLDNQIAQLEKERKDV